MKSNNIRCFAIIPAAGKSARMGLHKLLLPWGQTVEQLENIDFNTPLDSKELQRFFSSNSSTVLDTVLDAWANSRVDEIVLVLREDDSMSQRELASIELLEAKANQSRAKVTRIENPADMKASVIAGADFLERTFAPNNHDLCFVAPADLPRLSYTLINHLLDVGSAQIAVPKFGLRQGHPVLFPWSKLKKIRKLKPNEGIDTLIKSEIIRSVEFPADARIGDIDTPHDYWRELSRFRNPKINE